MDEMKLVRTVTDIRNYTDQFISLFSRHDSISFDYVFNDEYKV
jgi:hypothetical protein